MVTFLSAISSAGASWLIPFGRPTHEQIVNVFNPAIKIKRRREKVKARADIQIFVVNLFVNRAVHNRKLLLQMAEVDSFFTFGFILFFFHFTQKKGNPNFGVCRRVA
jgi:hypothetical protein